jgi:hypothetical protein
MCVYQVLNGPPRPMLRELFLYRMATGSLDGGYTERML